MRQERGMDVLPRLKGRFVPMMGQKALFFKSMNSVIMLKAYLISTLKYYIFIDNLVSFNRKVYPELDRIMVKKIP